MTRREAFTFAMSLTPFALAAFGAMAAGQKTTEAELVGTWALVLVDNVFPDGRRVQLYGPNPHGIAMFDASGRYSLQIMSDDRPKFAANDKSKGSADEYKAAVQGSNCHFGRYTLNEQDRSVTLHVEHATFSNWEGAELTWPFTLAGDDATFTIPHPTTGGPGVIGEVALKRLA